MAYLLDTNVVSELHKGNRAHAGVSFWYQTVEENELYLSVLVVGEIRQGIERLRHRDKAQAAVLEQRLDNLEAQMAGRIIPITAAVAHCWGKLNAAGPFPVIDGLLAATALVHDLVLVTRNVRDVVRSGVRHMNPFAQV